MKNLLEIIKTESNKKSPYSEYSIKRISIKFNDLLLKLNKQLELNSVQKNDLILLFEEIKICRIYDKIVLYLEPKVYKDFGSELLESKLLEKEKLLIWDYLDVFKSVTFLNKIYNDREWDSIIADLIIKSDYSFSKLFERRSFYYKNKDLFKLIKGTKVKSFTWEQTYKKVNEYSNALFNILKQFDGAENKVAFLTTNSPDMALFDLACLTSGIVNVMIPGNSVGKHAAFILDQTKASILITTDEKQLSKVKSIKSSLKYLEKVILLEGNSAEEWVISLEEFLEQYGKVNLELDSYRAGLDINSLATIMYTSGTTGEPKGIMFSHINIVYKRFCRAMALPDIGDNDRFLAYLPLFHTFGRYFEMTGAIFWGAEYVFMENPSLETMIANMKAVNPTIFISIPKKWMQLYEKVCAKVNIELDDVDVIISELKDITGGKLKWGLSAAGYLSPDIFQFFQQYGIELMSGFGMTEATGGISMTPIKKYRPNSLGTALPGIEMKVAEDGELLIRGHYVMMGYYDQIKQEVFDEEGWFATGDIMKQDEDNFIEIIDRKKEIYKNIKGETVAPQKIEKYFYDFGFIKQVFLAGDHRAFNTVLIYPEFDSADTTFESFLPKHREEYFSSVIATINKFLAPFERIMDFRIIDREFSADKGELTAKGTFKRSIIEANFSEAIESMYRKNYLELELNELKIQIPNWFLREKGSISSDVISNSNNILLNNLKEELVICKQDYNLIRIGSSLYKSDNTIDFQTLITNPKYWVGNKELVEFTGNSIIQWQRHSRSKKYLELYSILTSSEVEEKQVESLKRIIKAKEKSFNGLHLALLMLQSEANETSLEYIRSVMSDKSSSVYKVVSELLRNPRITNNINTKRELLKIILFNPTGYEVSEIFKAYLSDSELLLNDSLTAQIVQQKFNKEFIVQSAAYLEKLVEREIDNASYNSVLIDSFLNLLCEYGLKHPVAYEKLRQVFVKYQIDRGWNALSELAQKYRTRLRFGFRNWLGDNQTIAIDIETGEEYTWEDVIILEENIDEDTKQRIIGAITQTQILREAIFLFTGNILIRLNDLLPGGIWISLLRTYNDKDVYRLSVQTRNYGSYEIVLNINKKLNKSDVLSEVNWLIQAGSRHFVQELVEDFGGYWEEYDIWSGKFVPGLSVASYLRRECSKVLDKDKIKFAHMWEFFIWNASAAYFNFWRLTGYKLELTNPSIKNFIIATHDYQVGTKIISFSERKEFETLPKLFNSFYQTFIQKTCEKYPFLKSIKTWRFIFSGLINAEGEKKGLQILRQFKYELENYSDIEDKGKILELLNAFLDRVEAVGFMPKPLYFAIMRFFRWLDLNSDASLEAQAQMLLDLYNTYHLTELEELYSETRTRFFLETIFWNSNSDVKAVLIEIINKQHDKNITEENRLAKIAELELEYDLTKKEKFFLARLGYPHLKPEDSVDFVKSEGIEEPNLVVHTEDYNGSTFYIRNPISPKEISRLHTLFMEENLIVNFTSEHNFLIAISERRFIIGGLFFRKTDKKTLHMEKVVVANQYRKKGISEKLMNEFFNRAKDLNYRYVTTGFFRPEYFYHFGFKVERKYSGLVKKL
ncbi:MAG: GNAT family N-acetyltransferase [Melioribacteraceae bacterium]|nr:GNAT family N-acetyltransferase [Melioribacteraceae bacterium]